ncbi:hypothetical protein FRC10_002924 [Ceratobasidium sp. 414]|nr:hypothetical protein FRC10_002924 [Ceratobasidium sp. 414]
MTHGFNEDAMAKLQSGELYGIVCTDVAGMGIDILDIDFTVQYQLAEDYPMICQRNGRSARGKDKKGKSLVLFESRFLHKEKKPGHSKKQALEDKEAELTPAKWCCVAGSMSRALQVSKPVNTKQTATPVAKISKPKVKKRSRKCVDDLDQVVDLFINTHLHTDGPKCQREPGNQFFANPAVPKDGDPNYCCPRCCPPPPPHAECCDVCNPALADFLSTKMDKLKRPPHQHAPTTLDEDNSNDWTDVDHGLEEALFIWQDELAEAKWGPYHPVGGLGIIDDEQIEQIVRLTRHQLIPTMEDFERELKWLYMPEHGTEVLTMVHSSHPPPPPPPPEPVLAATTTLSTSNPLPTHQAKKP